MNATIDDGLLRSLDLFVGTVYWLEQPITIEAALAEAIEDWVALASAEHNDSEAWGDSAMTDSVGVPLLQLVEAVERLCATDGRTLTVATALMDALEDWCRDSSGPGR
ncbi:MAG: hypothetical protein ACE37B_01475 [Ilumatobacter sp.]|uniref:hypothetical protein n=1 Tax=Ilumatobacter sp. TaxID=1967498 RepID=UPI00391D6125